MCKMGTTPDSPSPTNMRARYGRHAGVRKCSSQDTVRQPRPSNAICSVSPAPVPTGDEEAHHEQTPLHHRRMAKQPVVQRRNIRPDNQKHDARVVEFVAPLGHGRTVVVDRVVCRAHAETEEGSSEEARKGNAVRASCQGVAGGGGVVEEEAGGGEP